jgi:hypothetical protein
VQWKPGKGEQHLAKRKAMGHLTEEATMDDYNTLIGESLNNADNLVYHYPFGLRDYYAVSGDIKGVAWLVIFGEDGVLETAFPPDDMADYLTKRGFVSLGRLEEVCHE